MDVELKKKKWQYLKEKYESIFLGEKVIDSWNRFRYYKESNIIQEIIRTGDISCEWVDVRENRKLIVMKKYNLRRYNVI